MLLNWFEPLNPNPKLLLGRCFGENMPPPGPYEPDPVTVAFIRRFRPDLLYILEFWIPRLLPFCMAAQLLRKVLCVLLVLFIFEFMMVAPPLMVLLAALGINWAPPLGIADYYMVLKVGFIEKVEGAYLWGPPPCIYELIWLCADTLFAFICPIMPGPAPFLLDFPLTPELLNPRVWFIIKVGWFCYKVSKAVWIVEKFYPVAFFFPLRFNCF